MDDFSTSGYAPAAARTRSEVSTLLGQVMFLVAVALGFLTAGALIGRDLSQGTAFILFLASIGMLLAQSFGGERFRVGTFAICWLYAIALLIGLGSVRRSATSSSTTAPSSRRPRAARRSSRSAWVPRASR